MFDPDSVPPADQELAAALIVAIQSGLLSSAAAMQVVDREIVERDEADAWLIDASLAKTDEGMLAVLRGAAGDHPMRSDLRAVLEATDLALAFGYLEPMEAASRILRIAYQSCGNWEKDLQHVLYNLDEQLTCACDYGGVPNPRCVEKALSGVFEATCARARWGAVWPRILL
jgi:hypothetical protein